MNVQRQFQNSAARWDKFDEFTGLVMANLSDVSSRISSSDNHSKEEKIEKLGHLKTCAYELRRIDAESKARSEALKDLSQRLHREQSRGEPIEDFTGIYQAGANKARQAANDQSLKKDDDVLAVDKLIKALTSDGDEQEEVIEAVGATQAVTRCPILNCDLVKPVKNSTCGHVYSLKGAISLLFQNNAARSHHIPTTLDQVPPNFTARCPGFGCNSSLSPATLRRDYSTELTQRQNQSASMRRDSLDIDVDVEVL